MPTFPKDMYIPHTYLILLLGFFYKVSRIVSKRETNVFIFTELSSHYLCILKHLSAYTSNINARKS